MDLITIVAFYIITLNIKTNFKSISGLKVDGIVRIALQLLPSSVQLLLSECQTDLYRQQVFFCSVNCMSVGV